MPSLLGRASLFGGRLGAFAIDNMVQVSVFACISVRLYCPAMHCTAGHGLAWRLRSCRKQLSVQCFAMLQGLYKFHQYQVVGRHSPTPNDENPQIYRMKLWATDAVRAKSKFWCVPSHCITEVLKSHAAHISKQHLRQSSCSCYLKQAYNRPLIKHLAEAHKA